MLRLHGRVLIKGAMCAALIALAMAVCAKQADAQSAAAAAAAFRSGCSAQKPLATRGLASAKKNQLQHLCVAAQLHVSKVNFWQSREHRWTLYPRYASTPCWKLSDDVLRGPRSLCILARTQVRVHSRILGRLAGKIQALLPKPRLVHNSLYSDFICIHGGEGAWNAVSAPYFYHGQWIRYYGGLQMDMGFQTSYGAEFLSRWGTADHWPAWAQIQAAEKAYRSGRGFGPWPNTARACGLL